METLLDLLRAHGADADIIALAERLVAANAPEPEEGDTNPESRLLVFPGDSDPLSDEELEQLRTALEDLRNDDGADIELLVAARDTVRTIRTEESYRDEAADAARAERDALVAELAPEATGDEATEETEGGEETEGEETPAGDGEVTTGTPDGEITEIPTPEGEEAREGEPVLAGGGRRVSRADLARRRPRHQTPTPGAGAGGAEETPTRDLSDIIFAADIPETPAGRVTHVLADVDRAMERRRDAYRRSRRSNSAVTRRETEEGILDFITVATVMNNYPDARRLLDEDGQMLSASQCTNIIRNAIDAGIEQARNRGGLLAAGGLCALPTPIYNVVTYGNPSRPIRDQALVSFQASRGGVTDLAPPTLGNILTGDAAGRAISEWTVQNDTDATAGTPVKPCQRITCGAQRTTQIYAVTFCLTVGNFLARTYPELQNAWSSLSMVAHARFSEALMFARLQALSTTTTNTMTDFSASRDVLAVLDQTAAGMRSRHRLEDDFPFIVILPSVLLTIMRTDIARALPGGSFQENLTLAQAEINAWFAARSLNPVWSPDINTIGNQGVGALAQLPPTIDYVMFPAGTFIHLDGGELDLGVVRDTATNAVNDFQIFSETFENIHMVGPESIDGTIDVCPSGAVAGTIDPAPMCASYT